MKTGQLKLKIHAKEILTATSSPGRGENRQEQRRWGGSSAACLISWWDHPLFILLWSCMPLHMSACPFHFKVAMLA